MQSYSIYSFLVWLLSFSVIILDLSMLFACFKSSFFFMVSSVSLDGYYTICLSIQLLMNFDCFKVHQMSIFWIL